MIKLWRGWETEMADKPDDKAEEKLDFWYGWKGLYAFLVIYGLLQIVLLIIFTKTLTLP